MKNKHKQGFTLVEIMIVVVIIGLLAGMAIPAFQKVRSTSQQKAALNNLRQITSAAQQIALETNDSEVLWKDILANCKNLTDIGNAYKFSTGDAVANGLDLNDADRPFLVVDGKNGISQVSGNDLDDYAEDDTNGNSPTVQDPNDASKKIFNPLWTPTWKTESLAVEI